MSLLGALKKKLLEYGHQAYLTFRGTVLEMQNSD